MTLDAAGCLGCLSMHQGIYMDAQVGPGCSCMSINVQVVPSCTNTFLWMHKMTHDATGCSGLPLMQLDVLACSLMYQDASGCLSMHILMDAQDDPGCSWMLKMTLDAAGCLGCLSMYKLCFAALTHFYVCSR